MPLSSADIERRLNIAHSEAERLASDALGIILTGSVAYASASHIRPDSDIDLVVVVENCKGMIPHLIDDQREHRALHVRYFEGYCVTRLIEDIPLSIHAISRDAFDIICKCFVADLRVYRLTPKAKEYTLFGFDRTSYRYRPKNIVLDDLTGVRTIVPISFIHKDRFFVGIHRDKLLSGPQILYEANEYVTAALDKLWSVVVTNLHDEAVRVHGRLDLKTTSVANALAKFDNMRPEVKEEVISRTSFYLKKLRK